MRYRSPLFLASALLTAIVSRGAAAVPLEVAVAVDGQQPAPPIAAEMVVDGGPEHGSTLPVEVPGAVRIEVAEGSTVRVSVSAAGYWSPPQVVHVTPAPQRIDLTLRPTGWITGTIRVPPSEAMPGSLTLRVRPAPGSADALQESTWECDVAEPAFRCEVPAGRADLRLRAKGFVSHYRWGVEIPAHAATPLGTLALRPGASIVGWVEAPTREFRFDDVTVEGSPIASGQAPSAADRQRVESLVERARVNDRGFFEFPAIAPGSYAVTIRHPAYAPARIAPVQVLEGAETEIRRVELSPPVAFEVRLHTPTDPFHQLWRIDLLEVGDVPGYLDHVDGGVASPDGRWSAEGLAPGDYVVQVADSRRSRWLSQDVTLSPDMSPLDLDLPFDRLEGELTLGGEPLAATLHFGGATAARRVSVTSDEEGKFYVFLPRQDSWLADIVKREIGLSTRIEGIEVRKLPGQAWAKVQIDLPDTRVFGEAVDEEGRPLPGAIVEAIGGILPPPSARASKPDGEFQLVGLEPGEWRLEARYSDSQRRLSSDVVAIEVGDREDAEPLTLVLREGRRISGLVVSPSGRGVAGATVVAMLDRSRSWLSSAVPQAVTDVEGGFDLWVPHGTAGVVLSVLAPGFTLTTLRLEAPPAEPLVVTVEDVGGTVRIEYDGGEEISPVLRRHFTNLFAPDQIATSSHLGAWAQAHGVRQDSPGEFVIPMLPPGEYTACFQAGEAVFFSRRLPDGGLPGRCASGTLAPFGELRLTVPIPDEGIAEPASPGSIDLRAAAEE